MQEITRDIESVEVLIAQVNSLHHKFCGNEDSKEIISFIIELMRGKEVIVEGGSKRIIGQSIATMFNDAQKV